jgi:hypothetical protein|tara:strand:+ start:2417 stop:2680 length:264 start_codon:yes stop_codon:yes gene_type:complete
MAKEVVKDGLVEQPTTEAPVETVETPAEPQIHTISLGDLNAVIRIIDVVTKRGAINGDELADVGAVRNRIQAFITASTPAVEEKPAE